MTLNKPSGWEDWINTVQCMDCLKGMGQMPEGVVHCVVTSPPYYGLRDYGTAKWEGGEADCDHKAPDEAGQTEKPTVGQRTHAGRFAGSTCWKCGATRTDPQLGLEKTPELYVSKMVEVFREVKRIMHPTATLWLNLGDSYASGGGEGKNRYFDGRKEEFGPGNRPRGSSKLMKNTGLKPKDLLEMPSRLVLALQADGWWIRCRIPWLKRNAMPESTDDRPTQAVEYIFLLTKSGTPQYWTHRDKDGVTEQPKADWRWVNAVTQEETTEAPPDWKEIITCPRCEGTGIADIPFEYEVFGETVFEVHKGECPVCDGKKEIQRWKRVNLWRGHDYFYDGEAVRVKQTGTAHSKGKKLHPPIEDAGVGHKDWHKYTPDTALPFGRSRRNSDWFFESWQGLWTDENGWPLAFIVNPKPYKRSHFATFPPGLVIPCLKAGTSERGACPECGSPWVRVIQSTGYHFPEKDKDDIQIKHGVRIGRYKSGSDFAKFKTENPTKTLGWRPTCSCSKEPVPCLCFDPFAGTGTVIEVARKMGRAGLGFEISEEYVKKYCGERLAQGVLGLKTEGA